MFQNNSMEEVLQCQIQSFEYTAFAEQQLLDVYINITSLNNEQCF